MTVFLKHIFICTHQRKDSEGRSCCADKNGVAIKDMFKKEVKERGLKGKVRANASGCLDHCAEGPSVVVYPEGIWYTVNNREDVLEIMEEHINHDRPVKRLMMKKNHS